MFARHLRPRNFSQLPPLRNTALRRIHFSHPPPPLQTSRAPLRNPKHAAIEPVAFALAFTLSVTAAYALDRYTKEDPPPEPIDTPLLDQDDDDLSLQAQKYPDVMASPQAPGRPGNLTPEEQVKLKEMWAQALEIFGVAPEGTHSNGTATPTTAPGAPDQSKKTKSKGFFGRKSKDDTASGVDNEKHGQTQEFQQALSSHKPEELRAAFWDMVKHDHPDALLLRFLRARKWDVHAALVMAVSTIHWRLKDMHVDDDIMINGEEAAIRDSKTGNAAEKKEGADFAAQLHMGKSFVHGTDKDGRPCCYVRAKLHKAGEQSEKSLERFTVYLIETTRLMLKPPIDTAVSFALLPFEFHLTNTPSQTLVFDLSDFSLANMDYTPVKFIIKCFEANYPESLGCVLVYKAPWVFQGIWKIIRGWLDPVVANKVQFCSNVDELQQWIPRGQIMKELGGDEDYTYTYVEPVEGENKRMQDTATRDAIKSERAELAKSYESETLAWIAGQDAGEGRTKLAQRLSENYWKLDPYVRSRSLYDRTGVISEGGKLNFYPSRHDSRIAAASNGELD
jgi:hypothetical protein